MDIAGLIYKIALFLPGFLIAIVGHEYAHGWAALKFGDTTAQDEGRLTFNPVAHIDPFGTILFPVLLLSLNFGIFGWAKPVPVNGTRFKNYRKGLFWVSFAGPIANFIMMVISGFLFAVVYVYAPDSFSYKTIFLRIFESSIYINTLLGVFNLIPIPPLDGSKMVMASLNYNAARKYESLSQYANFIFMGLILLSFAGFPILHYILQPAQIVAYNIRNLFVILLG